MNIENNQPSEQDGTPASQRCPVTLEDLYSFLDDALPPERADEVTAHISRCLACSRTLARLELEYKQQVLAYLQGAKVPLPPPSRFVDETYALLEERLSSLRTERAAGADALSSVLESRPLSSLAARDRTPEDASIMASLKAALRGGPSATAGNAGGDDSREQS